MKFFGVSFLSRPSTLVTAQAAKQGRLEVPWMMQVPQVLLAAICVLLGIVPAAAFQLMQHALNASRQGFGALLADAMPITGGPLAGVQGLQGIAVFAPFALAALLGVILLLVRFIAKQGGAERRAAAPWLCGYVREADCHRYTAHNFYGEIKRYFGWLGGTSRTSPGKQGGVKEHEDGRA
jgi:NADH:ubiquinone oxidoreductase subunit 5 (subunit L)/multisubunit Na+/H+ antiporter MnhA subunit